MIVRELRCELKRLITETDRLVLAGCLGLIASRDTSVGEKGVAWLSSLYFGQPLESPLRQTLDLSEPVERFCLWYDNHVPDVIYLEKKYKLHGFYAKEQTQLTKEECTRLLVGDWGWMECTPSPLIRELGECLDAGLLEPLNPIRYTQQRFLYPAEDAQVILNSGFQWRVCKEGFLNPYASAQPVEGPAVLEIHYYKQVPSLIENLVPKGCGYAY